MEKVKPDALLILGDTYSGLSVMPAANRGIKIFHMEAGLRAWDRRMPEQRNRILIDHMSNILLPYNQYHRENLIRENIHPSKIFVTGNTTFEAMRAFAPQIDASDILERLGLEPKGVHSRHCASQRERRQSAIHGEDIRGLGTLGGALQARRHLSDAPAHEEQGRLDLRLR